MVDAPYLPPSVTRLIVKGPGFSGFVSRTGVNRCGCRSFFNKVKAAAVTSITSIRAGATVISHKLLLFDPLSLAVAGLALTFSSDPTTPTGEISLDRDVVTDASELSI